MNKAYRCKVCSKEFEGTHDIRRDIKGHMRAAHDVILPANARNYVSREDR